MDPQKSIVDLLFEKWSGRSLDDASLTLIVQFRQFLLNTFQAGDDMFRDLPEKTRKEIEQWIEQNKPVINEMQKGAKP